MSVKVCVLPGGFNTSASTVILDEVLQNSVTNGRSFLTWGRLASLV